MTSCVHWTTIGTTIASITSSYYWKLDYCEGLCSKLCSCFNGLRVDCVPILNLLQLDSKQESIQMCSTQQLVLIGMV